MPSTHSPISFGGRTPWHGSSQDDVPHTLHRPPIFREVPGSQTLAVLPISAHTTCEPEHCSISKNSSSFSTCTAFSAGGAACPPATPGAGDTDRATAQQQERAGPGTSASQTPPASAKLPCAPQRGFQPAFPRIPPPPDVLRHPTHRHGSLKERGQAPSPPRQPRTLPRPAPRTHPDGAGDAAVLCEKAAVGAVAALAQPHRAGAPAQAARQRRAALREGGQQAAALGLQLGQVAGQPRAPQLLRQLLRQLQRRGLARPRGGGEAEQGERQRRQQPPAQIPRRRHGGRAEEPEAPGRERAGPRPGAPPLIGRLQAGAGKWAGGKGRGLNGRSRGAGAHPGVPCRSPFQGFITESILGSIPGSIPGFIPGHGAAVSPGPAECASCACARGMDLPRTHPAPWLLRRAFHPGRTLFTREGILRVSVVWEVTLKYVKIQQQFKRKNSPKQRKNLWWRNKQQLSANEVFPAVYLKLDTSVGT